MCCKIPHLKEKLICLGMAAVLIGIMWIFHLPCPFRAWLDIPCPGCGMTRAYQCLLHLDWRGAFEWHPMFWSVPVLLLLYLFDGRLFKPKWVNTAVLMLILAGFFIQWIFKWI